ncbi:MAG: LamG domain-containing protein [Epibacterium sp.]|nr:LamG domain-containing protein [Epibacterium sp.]NQX74075.1 hypothetical protein [Epibacterium sp.]
MTALFEDNFELYGGDNAKMLDGVWASFGASFVGSANLTIPTWEEEDRHWLRIAGRGDSARAVFPAGGQTGVGMWTEMYMPSLPLQSNRGYCMQMRNSSNDSLVTVVVQTDGTLAIYASPTGLDSSGLSGGTLIASTTTPVIQAATTHYLQMEVDFSAGDLELRVDGVTVASVTSSSNIGGVCVGIAHAMDDASGGSYADMNFKATCAYSLSGTYNSSWPSISGIKTVLINEDTGVDNLTPRPRNYFDAPVMFNDRDSDDGDVRSGLTVESSDVAFDFGTGDYTLEGAFRFKSLPVSGETYTLMGVWNEDQNGRAYRLSFKASDVDGGGLQFEYTTDGTDATRVTVHDINFEPQIGIWYHIAVARDSSTNDSRLFIQGVQNGPDQTDSANYFGTSSEFFSIGNGTDGNTTAETADDAFDGHIRNVRVTKGIVRYTSNFTPPSANYPTTVGGDPNFNSVSLLVFADDPTDPEPVDQSANAFEMEQKFSCDVIDYADTVSSFQAAGTNDPFDDRYLESAFPKATGILTLSANPADTETVTIGAQTYTFNTVLGAANSILIGSDADDSLTNLTDAINGGDGAGVRYGAGTATNVDVTAENATPATNQMTVTAIIGGSAKNSVATTETLANGAWGGATLSGGADLPGASEFGIQSLPPDATGVRWISVRHRSYVDDGSATIRTNLDVNGSESPNADEGLTTDPQYYVSRVEEDPDTLAALTVSSIENAKIKIERIA